MGIIAYYGRIFMKLYAALLLFTATCLYPMQSPREKSEKDKDKITHSPGREVKDDKERKTDSQHKRRSSSFKNLNLLLSRGGSGSPTSSASNSKIEGQGRTTSKSPEQATEEKKGSDIRRGSAAHIQRTLTAFMGDQSQEQKLDALLQQAIAIKNNRPACEDLLREIVNTEVTVASDSRYKAAQMLSESAQQEIEIGYKNVKKYQESIKTTCNEMLLAREHAIFAKIKELCAKNPNKFKEWCWHEAFTDPFLQAMTQKMKKFFEDNRITENMRLKDIEVPAHNHVLEAELGVKLEKAKSFVKFDRLQHEIILKEILETKMLTPSKNKEEAAQKLFISVKEQLVIAIANVKMYEQSKYTSDIKIELIKILKILEEAYYATRKEVCSKQPLKTDLWCGFEIATYEPLVAMHHEVDQFLISMKITEEMKTKDAPSQLLP